MILFGCIVNSSKFTFRTRVVCLQAVCGCFIVERPWKTRSSRSLALSWTGAKIVLERVTRRGGARKKPPVRKPVSCESPPYRHIASGGLSRIPYQPIQSLACDRPSIMFCKRAIQNKLTCSAFVRFFISAK